MKQMNNMVIFPILLPFISGILLLFFRNLKFQRAFSIISLLAGVSLSLYLIADIHANGIRSLDVSNWAAPFGITIVADMLSSILVLTTNVIALCVVIYSFNSIGKEREHFYYYPIFQMLLIGVNGAFLTGDIFNLFVFFEVMLMSSYVLLVLGGTKIQLRETIKYILVNVISSALFVITVAYLYSVVGTLNMAHLSERIAEIGQPGIITVIAVLFLIVFGLKGAVFPLFFWLPGSYYAAPAPVLALFGALLTKVGVYSITRTYTLMFYHDTDFTHTLLAWVAIGTIIIGAIGAVAYWDIKKIIIYNIIIAVGVIVYGISLYNETGTNGAVLYLVHDMIIKAGLFMLVGIIIYVTGTANLRQMGGLMKVYPALGWFYLIAAFGLAGIPPLSGFVGKLLIVQGGFEAGNIWSSIFILASSLIVLLSVMRIFIYAFWGAEGQLATIEKRRYNRLLYPTALLIVISIAYGVGAEWITPFMDTAGKTLVDPSIYVDAVMKGGE